MYAVTSHIAASLPLKTSEADEATSYLSALSIIKVSDGVAYTRTVLTARDELNDQYKAVGLPSGVDILDGSADGKVPMLLLWHNCGDC